MCVHNCTKRYIQSNTRISRGFADHQVKKMTDMMKANQTVETAQPQEQEPQIIQQAAAATTTEQQLTPT